MPVCPKVYFDRYEEGGTSVLGTDLKIRIKLGLEDPYLVWSVDPISESGSRYSKAKWPLKKKNSGNFMF